MLHFMICIFLPFSWSETNDFFLQPVERKVTALKNQETKILAKPLMQPQEFHLKTNSDLSLLIQLMS